MSRLATLLLLSLAAGSAYAQDACKPEYTVKYNSCANEKSETKIQTVTTDWIRVNEGADVVTEGLCNEKVSSVAAANRTATNVRYEAGGANITTKDSLTRNVFAGVGKKDVYCRFTMDVPTKVPQESEACGVQSVQSNNCVAGLTVETAKACIEASTDTPTDTWKKAGCLLDSFKNAVRIKGLDQATYEAIKFQLNLISESLASSQSPNERSLSNYVRQQLGR